MKGKRRSSWLALLALLTAAIAIAAAGCGGGDEGDTSGAAGTTPAETTGGEAVSVGLVTDIGGLNDRGFNSLANQGLENAESQLGVQGDVLESKSDADYIPNLSEFGQKGSNLVVSVGFLMTDATAQAAKAFPDSNFAIVDSAFDPAIPNAQGLLFKEQEAGCLVGVVGALTSKTGTITWVGGQKIPPVDRFIAGYEFCAKDANPDIRVGGAYLSALRKGTKKNPSTELLAALARFFGVPASYFLDEAAAARTATEIQLAQVAHNLGVRDLALRALELSPEGLAAVMKVVEDALGADGAVPPQRQRPAS